MASRGGLVPALANGLFAASQAVAATLLFLLVSDAVTSAAATRRNSSIGCDQTDQHDQADHDSAATLNAGLVSRSYRWCAVAIQAGAVVGTVAALLVAAL